MPNEETVRQIDSLNICINEQRSTEHGTVEMIVKEVHDDSRTLLS